MLSKTRAVVLHHIKYGDSSLIVTLYTEKFGRLSCMVNGVRAKKTKLPVTLFQPLTLLDAEVYYKKNREMQRLKEASCSFRYDSIPFTVTKSTIALFLAEILYLTLREEESNPSLFDFLNHAFQLLDSKSEGIPNFHLLFLLHYSKYLGFFPGVPDYNGTAMLSPDLRHFRDMPPEAARALDMMLTTSPAFPEHISLTNSSRAVLLDRIIRYYQEHLGEAGRIRSVQVLKDIFNHMP
jgi:DNA repair protein RecO (recombination protein O)